MSNIVTGEHSKMQGRSYPNSFFVLLKINI